MPATNGGCSGAVGVTFEPARDPFPAFEAGQAGGGGGGDSKDDDGLDERYRKLAAELFGETDESRERLLGELRREVVAGGFGVPLRRAFLLKLLRAGNFTVPGALEVLTNYVSILRDCPQYFSSATAAEAREIGSQGAHCVLPHRDRHGRRVMLYRAGRWNPDLFSFCQCFKLGYMLSELVALEPKTQIAGVTTISDASGFSFKQFRSFTLEDCRNAAKFVQESFPLWFRSVHVVNAPSLFYVAYNILKPLLSRQVRESIIFHKDLDSLHAHIDRSILPDELGGDAGPVDNSECLDALEKLQPLFDELANMQLAPAKSS